MTYDYNEETNTVLIKRESEETPEIIYAYFVRMMRDELSGSGSPVGYTRELLGNLLPSSSPFQDRTF